MNMGFENAVFDRTNSVFEDSDGASAGSYVNCELSNQMAGARVSILEDDLQQPQSGSKSGQGKMSKASAKAAKVKLFSLQLFLARDIIIVDCVSLVCFPL